MGLILFMVFGWAWYAWGFFGAFLFFSIVAVFVAWLFDKREAPPQRDADLADGTVRRGRRRERRRS